MGKLRIEYDGDAIVRREGSAHRLEAERCFERGANEFAGGSDRRFKGGGAVDRNPLLGGN